MKFLVPALLATALQTAPVWAAEQTVNFSVPGMYCASCPYVVEAAMGAVGGVISVSADATERSAVVVFDNAITTIEAIAAASANAGYEARVVIPES